MAESDETSETTARELDEAGITVSESDETGTTAAGEKTDEAGMAVATVKEIRKLVGEKY